MISVMVLLITFNAGIDRATDPYGSLEERMQKSAPGPDPRPSEWTWMQRTFPYWNYDRAAFQEETKKAQKMRGQAVENPLELVEFAGPTNIGGRVVDIEFNPQDPNIAYAGAATGGVFKSTDMGNAWFSIFDDQANLSVGDIGIDPVNPDIIYVGTGEANGGHNNFAGGGLFKSTDGGATWEFKGLGSTVSIGRVIVNPLNPQQVFVAAVGSYFGPNPERGVYVSANGGDTWAQSLFVSDSTGAVDIIMDPGNPSRMIAAMWERVRRPNSSHLYGATSGLYRSTNGGTNWENLGPANGLPNPNATNVGRIGLAISLSNPDIVYTLYTNGSNYLGLYKSTDFGTAWSNADPGGGISNGTATFSWYFGQVRVHPADPNTVYALDVAFMRSTNGGQNWPIIYGYGGAPPGLHVDHHALAFHPTNPDYLLEGNDGGINISTDAGVSWSKVANLPVTQFYEIGLDRNNPQRLYGGTQDNGTLRTLTGALDDWDHILGGDGFYVIVDHTNPDIIYAESQFGNLRKSTNGGSSFPITATNGINQNEPTNWSTPVVMDPNDNNILYYGTDRVYRTTNGASFWTAISPDLTDGISGTRLGTVTTIAVAPTNSNILWAGTDDSHVWVSTDYGVNWTDVSASLPYRWVTRVTSDPTDENTAYVTFSGLKWVDPQPHVFRTANLGQTWEDISSNLPDAPINGFAVDRQYPNFLFVGTDLGAYYSDDYGQSWQYLSSALPMIPVYDLKVHDTEHYLAIGTHGRSMYKLDLTQLTGLQPGENQPIAASFKLEQNYPNPLNPETNIRFRISETGFVTLEIFDVAGRKVATLMREALTPGEHKFQWNGHDDTGRAVGSGMYFYRLQVTGGKTSFQQTRKMLLVR
jgi:photosystem II stability/assembly factor-like uncharacterized protein